MTSYSKTLSGGDSCRFIKPSTSKTPVPQAVYLIEAQGGGIDDVAVKPSQFLEKGCFKVDGLLEVIRPWDGSLDELGEYLCTGERMRAFGIRAFGFLCLCRAVSVREMR